MAVMNSGQLQFQKIVGKEILDHIDQVAEFRIRYFQDFPYLYVGNLEYEQRYLDGFAQDEKAVLVKISNSKGDLLGISTGLPLVTCSDILKGASDLFESAGHDANNFYYYGEIILDYSLRGKGILRTVYGLQDKYSQGLGFTRVAIATVVREQNDPRKPRNFFDSDVLWRRLGFKRSPIEFSYSWPTIQKCGRVEETQNTMVYWMKELQSD